MLRTYPPIATLRTEFVDAAVAAVRGAARRATERTRGAAAAIRAAPRRATERMRGALDLGHVEHARFVAAFRALVGCLASQYEAQDVGAGGRAAPAHSRWQWL